MAIITFYYLTVPLVTGGILALVFLLRNDMQMAVTMTLTFYGLTLINVNRYINNGAHFLGLIEIILGIVVSSTPPRACYSGRSDSAFAIFYTASVRTQNTVRTKKLRPNIYKVFEIRIRSGVLCKGKENILQHLFSPGEKFSIFE